MEREKGYPRSRSSRRSDFRFLAVSLVSMVVLAGCSELPTAADLCTPYNQVSKRAEEIRSLDPAKTNVDQLRNDLDEFQASLDQLQAAADGSWTPRSRLAHGGERLRRGGGRRREEGARLGAAACPTP